MTDLQRATLIERFISYLCAHGCTTRTMNRARHHIATLFNTLPASLELHQITPIELSATIAQLRTTATETTVKPWSPSTINVYISTLKAFFQFLHDTKIITDKPHTGLEQIPVYQREPKHLTPIELQRILAAADATSPETGRIIRFLFYTGVRLSEFTAITWGDVDPEDRTILIHGTKTKRDRRVHITPDLHTLLKSLNTTHLSDSASHPLFTSYNRKPISDRAVQERLQRIARDTRTKLTPHILRHTYAVQLARAGIPLNVIQQQLGHKTLTSTQIYVQFTNTEIKQVLEHAKNPFAL